MKERGLVVVLAFLLVLLGLLLPAVQKVRQAAARMQSQNNLKQVGLAMHGYHDANAKLPPGVDDNHFSTSAYLLPYLEQGNLFTQANIDRNTLAQSLPWLATGLPVLILQSANFCAWSTTPITIHNWPNLKPAS